MEIHVVLCRTGSAAETTSRTGDDDDDDDDEVLGDCSTSV